MGVHMDYLANRDNAPKKANKINKARGLILVAVFLLLVGILLNIVALIQNLLHFSQEKTANRVLVLLVIEILLIIVIFLIFMYYNRTINQIKSKVQNDNEQLLDVFELLKEAVVMVREVDHSILKLNQAAKQYINFREQDVQYIDEQIQWISYDFKTLCKKILLDDCVEELEVELLDRRNNKRICLVSMARLEYRKESIIMLTLFDITEQELAKEQMHEIAIRDKLTGLYNRHYLEEIIHKEIEKSELYDTPLSMILFDIDYFKKINDTYGHQVGDSVLILMAKVAQEEIRTTDYLFRVGGEEFLIVLPHMKGEGASFAAERLRTRVEQIIHPQAGKFTASFGVAQRVAGETFRNLYKRVDDAMYVAKSSGRNVVAQASDVSEDANKEIAYSTKLVWKDLWDCGEFHIDEQHRELFRLSNELLHTFVDEQVNEQTMTILDAFIYHVQKHFRYEEAVLNKIEYEQALMHKNIHQTILKKGIMLKEQYLNKEIELVKLYSYILDEVIVGHLLNEDIKFYDAVKKYRYEQEEIEIIN